MTETDSGNVKLAIARRTSDARLIRIRDALALRASGQAADYACPYCEARVFTVDTSTDRAVHYRHEHGVECAATGGLETWLHHQAKKAFRDHKEIRLPSVDGYIGEIRSFASVAIEQPLRGTAFRPDALAEDIQGQIAVEFAVTHFCEPGKVLEYMLRKLPAIEVDLSAAAVDDLTPEQLDDWILFQAPRTWIASPAIADPEPEIVLDNVPEIEITSRSCSRPAWGNGSMGSGGARTGDGNRHLSSPKPRRQQPSSRPEIEQETPQEQEARWARNRIKSRYLEFRYGDQWTLAERWNRGRCQPGVGWTISPPEADEFEDVADWKAFEAKAIGLRNRFGEAAMWEHWHD
jgi:hypothetical protein